MKIKDEWVLFAARAAYGDEWELVKKSFPEARVRAGLEAVAPLIRAEALEEAAGVCSDIAKKSIPYRTYGPTTRTRSVSGYARARTGVKCAQAIRALKEGE
jgi:hypothetical protein